MPEKNPVVAGDVAVDVDVLSPKLSEDSQRPARVGSPGGVLVSPQPAPPSWPSARGAAGVWCGRRSLSRGRWRGWRFGGRWLRGDRQRGWPDVRRRRRRRRGRCDNGMSCVGVSGVVRHHQHRDREDGEPDDGQGAEHNRNRGLLVPPRTWAGVRRDTFRRVEVRGRIVEPSGRIAQRVGRRHESMLEGGSTRHHPGRRLGITRV
jgi:hypothetical protein